MSNYPLGAVEDSSAPFNRNTKKISYTYSISSSDYIEVDDKLTENEINELLCEKIKESHGNVSIDFLGID